MNIRLRNIALLSITTATLFVFSATATATAAQPHGAVTRGAMVALANRDRATDGVSQLTEDPVLDQAAQAKADDMAAKGYFSHVDPSGQEPWVWFIKAGYYYYGAGENLAINFTDAQTLENTWIHSPAHRANIVSDEYSRMGLGIAHGMYKGKPATFIVQFFAAPYLGAA